MLPTTLHQTTALYAQGTSNENPFNEINISDDDNLDPVRTDTEDVADSESADETLSAFAIVPEPMDAKQYLLLFDKWLDQQAQALFEQMTDHQRVGQLLVVTFEGDHEQLEADDVVSELETFIHEYHIGGFAISAYHGNFSNVTEDNPTKSASTPLQVAILNTKLQAAAYGWNLSEKQATAIISGAAPLTQTLKAARRLPMTEVAIQGRALQGITSQGITLQEITSQPRVHIPLFIAAQQDGDGLPNHNNEGPPNAQLQSEFTQQPSQLALGSTWNPDLVSQVGELIGQELRAVGVNMLLGPDLNIVDIPRSDQVGRLGIHSFGGSPYWVGEMGRAYIEGIHRGSAGSIATIAKHFPGQGDVDRLPNLEVATIQRSTEELEQITLDPFKRVTEGPPSPFVPINDPESISLLEDSESFINLDTDDFNRDELLPITDGLMSSHMRYSAIQNRETPLSLSPALQDLLGQESFDAWRQGGGLVMSNALGVQAIRHHYDPALTSFQFLPASVAFLTAGNDLLYINRLSNQDAWEANRENTRRTIDLFRRKYIEDSGFRADVDESVQRILRLKLRLYGNPSIETLSALKDDRGQGPNLDDNINNALADDAASDDASTGDADSAALEQDTQVGENGYAIPGSPELRPSSAIESDIHLQTEFISLSDVLIHPQHFTTFQTEAHQIASDDLIRKVARESITLLHKGNEDYVPTGDAQILIFTDSRLVKPCNIECPGRAVLEPENISDIILRLYGPGSTQQFKQRQINSATFADIINLLDPLQIDATDLSTSTVEASSSTTADDLENLLSGDAVVPLGNSPGVGQKAEPDSLETMDKEALSKHLKEANWIIFSMLDVDSESYPSSVALKEFLSKRVKDVQEKNIIVFGLDGPYFLDATEISKLTAYFGVYSKLQPFQEMAVRALFEGTSLTGAPASDVPGGDYRDLAGRLLPAPDQSITLQLYDQEDNLLFDTSLDNENGNTILVDATALLTLKTGEILDLNGRPVADGTEVVFAFDYLEEDVQAESSHPTKRGEALARMDRLRVGSLQIVVSSGQATSQEIVLKIEPPTPTPTDIPILIPTETPTPLPVSLAPVTLTPVPADTPLEIVLVPTPIPTQELEQPSAVITPTLAISPTSPTSPQITPTVNIGNVVSVTVVPTEMPIAVAAPQTPVPEPVIPTLVVITPAPTPFGLTPSVDPTTLVAMLSTMLLSLTLFVTATLRVLPRKTLVHHALWAINAGLAAYILYALELIPGTENLRQYLSIWTGAIVVLVAMLITLLWLQLRTQE